MTLMIQAVFVALLFAWILVLSPWFYRMYLQIFTTLKLRSLNYKLEELTYSLEEMIYFVTLPSMDQNLTSATPDQILVKPEFTSVLFPKLCGVSILIQPAVGQRRVIAYMELDRIGTPLLDALILSGTIDNRAYQTMASFRMLHPSTINEIRLEVHRQLQSRPRMI